MAPVADCWTRRGWGKRACADAVGIVDGRLVLSDGCSSSPDTDLGARLLVRAGGDVDRAMAWAQALELPVEALDATCLVAIPDADGITVQVSGDGVIAARRVDGALDFWRIEYPSNAPGYPTLDRAPARLAAWRDRFGDARAVHGPEGVRAADGHAALDWRFERAAYDRVAVFSDGVAALDARIDTETGRSFAPVAVADAIAALMAVASPRGAFVERRVRRLFDRTGWRARDDFAMGMWAWS